MEKRRGGIKNMMKKRRQKKAESYPPLFCRITAE